MSAFNLDNVSPNVENWINILARYNDEVTDNEIWDAVTGLPILPDFNNVYQELIMRKIVQHFAYEVEVTVSDLEFVYMHIERQYSSLIIEDTAICNEEDYDNAIEEYRERLDDRDAEEDDEDEHNWYDEDE